MSLAGQALPLQKAAKARETFVLDGMSHAPHQKG